MSSDGGDHQTFFESHNVLNFTELSPPLMYYRPMTTTATPTPTNWNAACREVADIADMLFTRSTEVSDLGRLQGDLYRLVRGCVAATLSQGTISRNNGTCVSRGLTTIYEDHPGPEKLDPEQVEDRTAAAYLKAKPLIEELLDECRTPLGKVGESRHHGLRAELFLKLVADAVERTQVGEIDACPGWKYVSEMASRVENLTFKILDENVTELHLLSHNDLRGAGWKNPVEARSLKEQKIDQRRDYWLTQGWAERDFDGEREHPHNK